MLAQQVLRLWRVFFLVVAVLLLPQGAWARPIYIGSVHKEPMAEIKKFLPFALYLGKQLQPEGFDQGGVVVAESIPEMAAFLRERKVDLYIDSPYPSLAVRRLSGSKFLLRRWKKGVGEYHAIIFARKDSSISRLEDLKGQLVAFEELFSSTGYFLPKLIMVQKGLKLAVKRDASDPVGPAEVGYLFSGADENTMGWVLRGKVIAGAMDDQSYENEAKENLGSLKIVAKTFSIPRQIVSYRSDLPVKLVARIKEILLTMDQSEDGRKTLQDFENTTKFDELPNQAMAPLLKAGKFIDAELGLK